LPGFERRDGFEKGLLGGAADISSASFAGWHVEIVSALDLATPQQTGHYDQLTVLVIFIPHQKSVGGCWIIPRAMLAQGQSKSGMRSNRC
jgi:hypothetical protein